MVLEPIELEVAEQQAVTFGADEYVPIVAVLPPSYEGAYEVTPSPSAQTLATSGMVMSRDVTIAPIPSNYGLITVSGHVITVS